MGITLPVGGSLAQDLLSSAGLLFKRIEDAERQIDLIEQAIAALRARGARKRSFEANQLNLVFGVHVGHPLEGGPGVLFPGDLSGGRWAEIVGSIDEQDPDGKLWFPLVIVPHHGSRRDNPAQLWEWLARRARERPAASARLVFDALGKLGSAGLASLQGNQVTAMSHQQVLEDDGRMVAGEGPSPATCRAVPGTTTALAGGVVGLAAASFLQTITTSTTNFQSFSELAFYFALTPQIVVGSVAFALAMGLVGGFLPAVKASRIKIVDALRAD